jgi:hypothetical protein
MPGVGFYSIFVRPPLESVLIRLPEPETPEVNQNAEDSPLTIPSSSPSPTLQLSVLSLLGGD